MNNNNMCNSVSEQVVDTEKIPQIIVQLADNCIIQLPLEIFNRVLTQEVTNFIMSEEKDNPVLIDPKEFSIECFESKYNALERQLNTFDNYIKHLESDLKKDKFAQPRRYLACSVYQNFNYISNKMDKAISLRNCNEIPEILILDSEDEETTEKSNFKPVQTNNENTELIDVDYYSQNCNVNHKLKTNVSVPGVNLSDNDKVQPINTDADKTLNNVKCLSTSIPKRKPGPKSKTMYVEHCVSSSAENKNTIKNKINDGKVNKLDDKPKTTNSSGCSSVRTLSDAKNANLCCNISSKKYPPPFPSTPLHNSQPSWKNLPQLPEMKIDVLANKVTLTWDLKLSPKVAEIKVYELFVCQETGAHPDISMWKKKGNIKPDRLPMACELEIFDLGFIYHFAMRAVDVHDRCAPFAVLTAKI